MAVAEKEKKSTPLNKALAFEIRKQNLTQEQFAKKAKVAATTINNILNGNRNWISADTVKKIVKACGLNYEQAGRILMKA